MRSGSPAITARFLAAVNECHSKLLPSKEIDPFLHSHPPDTVKGTVKSNPAFMVALEKSKAPEPPAIVR